jgi:hypothetical protein
MTENGGPGGRENSGRANDGTRADESGNSSRE